jgi:AcrR family transcriptional regulator
MTRRDGKRGTRSAPAPHRETGATARLEAWLASIPAELRAPDGGGAQARIYRAALRRFAEDGFRATTTRSIAKAAGVNLAMLHYYFGSKERLYRRVFAGEIVEFFILVARALRSGEEEPADIVLGIPLRVAESMQANPLRFQLVRREFGDGATRAAAIVQQLGAQGPRGFKSVITSVIAAAQADGAIVDLDPRVILAFLLSHVYGLLFMEPAMRVVLGGTARAKGLVTALLSAERDLLRRALLTGGTAR